MIFVDYFLATLGIGLGVLIVVVAILVMIVLLIAWLQGGSE